jgi:predicted TIM-barrel fold metal-dependent hydrolase
MSATTQPIPALRDAIDVNVHLSRWPFRRLPLDETPALVAKLKSLGIRQAWAGNFDAVLHKDIAGVNERTARMCDKDGGGVLVPIGSINPMLPDWEEDLRRCRDQFKMPAVRLYPNYHGCKLDDPVFARLLEQATAAGLLVQIAVSMEDERTQHPLVRVAPVDLTPLPAVLKQFPKARVMLLNAIRASRGGLLSLLNKTEQVSFDIAALEGVGGVATAIEQIGAERIVFGTHAPFYYPESAALKMTESRLPEEVAKNVISANAARLPAK